MCRWLPQLYRGTAPDRYKHMRLTLPPNRRIATVGAAQISGFGDYNHGFTLSTLSSFSMGAALRNDSRG